MKKIYSIKDQMKKRSAADKTALKKWLQVGHRNGWFKYAVRGYPSGRPAALAVIQEKMLRYIQGLQDKAEQAALGTADPDGMDRIQRKSEIEENEIQTAFEHGEWGVLIDKGIITEADLPPGESAERPWWAGGEPHAGG